VETYLERVPPAAWRVYAAALAFRNQQGDWPSRDVIRQLAESECVRFEVALVLTRFELSDANGEPVPLDDIDDVHPPAVVPYDPDILWAILATRREVWTELRDERGKLIPLKELAIWAHSWSMPRSGTSTARPRRARKT